VSYRFIVDVNQEEIGGRYDGYDLLSAMDAFNQALQEDKGYVVFEAIRKAGT
jgi:hypothetical protein